MFKKQLQRFVDDIASHENDSLRGLWPHRVEIEGAKRRTVFRLVGETLKTQPEIIQMIRENKTALSLPPTFVILSATTI